MNAMQYVEACWPVMIPIAAFIFSLWCLNQAIPSPTKKEVVPSVEPPKPYSTFDAWRSDLLDPNVPIDTILERSALGVPKKPMAEDKFEIRYYSSADEPPKLRSTIVLDEVADTRFFFASTPKGSNWVYPSDTSVNFGK